MRACAEKSLESATECGKKWVLCAESGSSIVEGLCCGSRAVGLDRTAGPPFGRCPASSGTRRMAEIAVGKPTGTTIDIAGPEPIRMDDLVRQYLQRFCPSLPGSSHHRPKRRLLRHARERRMPDPRPKRPLRPDPFWRMVDPFGVKGVSDEGQRVGHTMRTCFDDCSKGFNSQMTMEVLRGIDSLGSFGCQIESCPQKSSSKRQARAFLRLFH